MPQSNSILISDVSQWTAVKSEVVDKGLVGLPNRERIDCSISTKSFGLNVFTVRSVRVPCLSMSASNIAYAAQRGRDSGDGR